MKFVKREEYQGGADEGLLKFGRAEGPHLGTKDAVAEYLKGQGLSEDDVEKAAEELGDGGAFPFVLSNANPDREGDSIDQTGWDLTAYRKNPVVLWAHDYSTLPVGRAVMTFVSPDGQLKAIDRFAASHDLARTVEALYRERFLNAVSVGFRPTEWDFAEERGPWAIDFAKQELLEHSAVPVPAHPEALLEARSAGIDVAPLREFYEKALDEHGLLLIPRKKLEAAWKATGVDPVRINWSVEAPTIEVDPVKAVHEASTETLLKALAERGVALTLIAEAPKVTEPQPPKANKVSTTDVLASIKQEVKSSIAAPYREALAKLKTGLTGQLD